MSDFRSVISLEIVLFFLLSRYSGCVVNLYVL